LLKESSLEVSLHLEHSQKTYIFVLSVMARSKAKTEIIVHLMEKLKSVSTRLVGFCIIFDGETYCSGREKILTLIGKELHR
jgi:hypothetical protein